MHLQIQGLLRALCKSKDFSKQGVQFTGFSILHRPCIAMHLITK